MKGIKSIFYKPKVLHKYIECFREYNVDWAGEYTLIPNGRLQLFFQLDAKVNHKTSFTNGWEERPNNFIVGPYNKGYQIELEDNTKMFSVLFKPGKYSCFFKNPIDDFTNRLYSPETIWGKSAKGLDEYIYNVCNNHEKCNILEEFLVSKLKERDYSPIETAIDSIVLNRGVVNIANISSSSGLSFSQFRKRFKKEVGLSPKEFQKITRINSLEEYRVKNQHISLTELACEFEYSDQSHFIKDFKSLSGLTPKRYFH